MFGWLFGGVEVPFWGGADGEGQRQPKRPSLLPAPPQQRRTYTYKPRAHTHHALGRRAKQLVVGPDGGDGQRRHDGQHAPAEAQRHLEHLARLGAGAAGAHAPFLDRLSSLLVSVVEVVWRFARASSERGRGRAKAGSCDAALLLRCARCRYLGGASTPPPLPIQHLYGRSIVASGWKPAPAGIPVPDMLGAAC